MSLAWYPEWREKKCGGRDSDETSWQWSLAMPCECFVK